MPPSIPTRPRRDSPALPVIVANRHRLQPTPIQQRPHTVQLITFKRVFSVAQNVSSLTGSSGLYYIHCVCLIDQPPVIRPTGVARSYRNVIDGTAGFMYAADSAICCPSEEHDHMGIRSGADQNIAWLQFFAADAFSKSCKAAGSLIGETVPGHRPVNPADPAGAVQSL